MGAQLFVSVDSIVSACSNLRMKKISLQEVQSAQMLLAPVIKKTEMDLSISASKRCGAKIYFKYENEQLTGSFKIRGAYNKIHSLTESEKKSGVIASSAGNHAQGVAYSASHLGVKSTIVMPTTASLMKVAATEGYGAKVVLYGKIYDEAFEKAKELQSRDGSVFVHPFEDPFVIAGQGTLGLEMLAQIPQLTSIIVPIGGGGLISGISFAVKTLNPKCRIIGVQSDQAPAMRDLKTKHSTPMNRILTIADGIAVKNPSKIIYEQYISQYVDEIVTVSDQEICEAIVFLMERSKSVVEGSGAAGLAALFNRNLNIGEHCGVLLCGGNIDLNLISKVINRGRMGTGRLKEISLIVDDAPGNLLKMTKVVADHGANILDVRHDRLSLGLEVKETQLDFTIETVDQAQIDRIEAAFVLAGAVIIQKK